MSSLILPTAARVPRRFLLVDARWLRLTSVHEDRRHDIDSCGMVCRPCLRVEHTLSTSGGELLYVEAWSAEEAVATAPSGPLWLVFDAATGDCCTGAEVGHA